MEFTNSEIDVKTLPTIKDIRFEPLDRNYHKQLKAEGVFFALVWIGTAATALVLLPFLREWSWIVPFILFVLLIGYWLMWISFHAWEHKGYALREHDILFKTGIWFKSTTVVAFNRIQHVEIQQGPLDRFFNVTSLILYTAGGSASDLTIPGLHPDDAQKLKDHVTRKSSPDEEE